MDAVVALSQSKATKQDTRAGPVAEKYRRVGLVFLLTDRSGSTTDSSFSLIIVLVAVAIVVVSKF